MDTPDPERPGVPQAPVEGGSYWAQWEYTLEEWQLFDQRDWERAVRSYVRSLWDVARFYVSLVAISTLFLTVAGLISPTPPLVFGARVLGSAIGLLVMVLIYGMIDALQLFNLNKYRGHDSGGTQRIESLLLCQTIFDTFSIGAGTSITGYNRFNFIRAS